MKFEETVEKGGPVVVLFGESVLGCHVSTVPGNVFDTGEGVAR
jgi:hypothetical protein